MTPRKVTFSGQTESLTIAPGAVVRIAPALHSVGASPPVPPVGSVVSIDTVVGKVAVTVVTSGRDCLVLAVGNAKWITTPVKRTEADDRAAFVDGRGASEWVIRAQR